MPGFFALYPSSGGGSSGVTSLDGMTGALTLVAGSGISIVDGSGTITISAAGGAAANQSLSNLTNPTAINQDLLPGGNNVFNIGANGNIFSSAFIGLLNDTTGATSIDVNSRHLIDSTNLESLDFNGRELIGSDGTTVLLNWNSQDPTGSLDVNTHPIINVLDPVNPQDAATKNYVDTHASAPAGTAGQLQYNSGSSSLAASSHLTYDSSAQTLYIGSIAPGGSPWITWQTVIQNPIPLVLLSGYTGTDHGLAVVCSGVANLQGVLGDGSATNLTLQASGGNIGIGGAAGIDLLTIAGSVAVGGQIHNVTDPTSPQDAATKAYVDAAASGANTALSNLASVAINTSLLPGTTNTIALGSSSKVWTELYIGDGGNGIQLVSGGSATGNIYPFSTTPSGVAGVPSFLGTAGGTNFNVAMFTQSSASANAVATGNVLIETGNKTAGTGNSGNISMTTGTSSGGTQGFINMNALYLGLPSQAADPTAPAGSIYYNTGSNTIRWFNGTAWASLL